MKILLIMDLKNYEPYLPRFFREAVRAVILKDGKYALVRSEKEGYLKFPGGGIEKRETHQETLIRETKEETGLQIKPATIKEYGMIKEMRKSIIADEIFEQNSYYYFCEVEDEIVENCLDDYEEELGYNLEYIDVDEAIKINEKLVNSYESEFIKKDTNILRFLRNNL